jgi:hypothetical protein
MKNFLDQYWEEFAGKMFGFIYIFTSHERGLTVMDQCEQLYSSVMDEFALWYHCKQRTGFQYGRTDQKQLIE